MIGNWITGIGITIIIICSAIDGYQDSQFRKACEVKNGFVVKTSSSLECMKKDLIIKIE